MFEDVQMSTIIFDNEQEFKYEQKNANEQGKNAKNLKTQRGNTPPDKHNDQGNKVIKIARQKKYSKNNSHFDNNEIINFEMSDISSN